jgi:hypothetical protein
MSSRNNGLAVLALLVGLGGLGLGVYSVFFTPEPAIVQIWTIEQPTIYYTSGSYADIPDMDLTITVNTGEKVMILFNGEFTANIGVLIGGVRLMRDNVEIPSSRREFNIETSGGALMGYSITTHVLINGLAAGTYEIEVQAFGVGVSEYINEGVLAIYTYN